MIRIVKFACFFGCLALLFVGSLVGIDRKIAIQPELIQKDSGYAYTFPIEQFTSRMWDSLKGDAEGSEQSTTLLYEERSLLGPPHSLHTEIRTKGGGRYCHWNSILYFSTLDNSDPRSNGKHYSIVVRSYFSSISLILVFILLAVSIFFCSKEVFLILTNARITFVILLFGIYFHFFGWRITYFVKSSDILPDESYAYKIAIPAPPPLFWFQSDSLDGEKISGLKLFEGQEALGPAHTIHDVIRTSGKGPYSHWKENLIFSSSDNSDPRQNNRTYSIQQPAFLSGSILLIIFIWWLSTSISFYRRVPNPRAFLISLLFLVFSVVAYPYAWTVALWIILGIGACSFIKLVIEICAAFSAANERVRKFGTNFAISVGSVFLALAFVESIFWVREWVGKTAFSSSDSQQPVRVPQRDYWIDPVAAKKLEVRKSYMRLPPEWERRDATVEGAKRAFYWIGALHVLDDHNMRRNAPFPPKDPHKFRIIVIGDSTAYGLGVEEQHTYPSVLESLLHKNGYEAEVLNLGVMGYQSEDFVHVLERFLQKLDPDLVVYGMFLNDFYETGIQQRMRMRLPIPKLIETRSSLGLQIQNVFQWTMIHLGIETDFYKDILKNMEIRGPRFLKDMKEMNELVVGAGKPPIISLVVNQFPNTIGDAFTLTQDAERYMTKAGMMVIPSRQYNEKYQGENFWIGFYEGHPNEEAHAIFADLIFRSVKMLPQLSQFSIRHQ